MATDDYGTLTRDDSRVVCGGSRRRWACESVASPAMVNEPRNLFKPVYDAFARESPPTLMMRIVTERAFSAPALDDLLTRTAERPYAREVLFSSLVELTVLVVTGARPSVHRAWQRSKDTIGATVRAVYSKL